MGSASGHVALIGGLLCVNAVLNAGVNELLLEFGNARQGFVTGDEFCGVLLHQRDQIACMTVILVALFDGQGGTYGIVVLVIDVVVPCVLAGQGGFGAPGVSTLASTMARKV